MTLELAEWFSNLRLHQTHLPPIVSVSAHQCWCCSSEDHILRTTELTKWTKPAGRCEREGIQHLVKSCSFDTVTHFIIVRKESYKGKVRQACIGKSRLWPSQPCVRSLEISWKMQAMHRLQFFYTKVNLYFNSNFFRFFGIPLYMWNNEMIIGWLKFEEKRRLVFQYCRIKITMKTQYKYEAVSICS